jgi:hypothetical protein
MGGIQVLRGSAASSLRLPDPRRIVIGGGVAVLDRGDEGEPRSG